MEDNPKTLQEELSEAMFWIAVFVNFMPEEFKENEETVKKRIEEIIAGIVAKHEGE